jgi:hypothetical protein
MKKNIIIFGLVAGLIVTAMMLAAMAKLFDLNNYAGSMLLGYASMLVAFSLIFLAVKNQRDKDNAGSISFGKGFRIGLGITLIASTIYVLIWLIDYYYFIPDFYEKYAAHQLLKLKATGATQTQINAQAAQINAYARLYRNPFFNAMITYTEILPIGLMVSVLAAAILKRKRSPGKVEIAS